MTLIDILVLAVLFFSFIGGMKEGVVGGLFSLLALVIAIPFAGTLYYVAANFLAFLPGTDMENFIGFFVTLALTSLVLHFVFWLPRRLAEKLWSGGILFRLLGGLTNLVSAGIGLVLFTLVLAAYPIIGWLARAMVNTQVIAWLAEHLSFVAAMLPGIFRISADFTARLW